MGLARTKATKRYSARAALDEPVRHVLEDGPPEQDAGGEVTDVLEVQQRAVLERGVVDGREVPGEVGDEPEAERDGRAREEPRAGQPGEPRGEGRRDAEHEQRRSPLGEDDVLEQVGGEQMVGERVERRDCGREAAAGTPRRTRAPPLLEPVAAHGDAVRDEQRDDGKRRLEVKRPGVWVRAADPRYASAHARP